MPDDEATWENLGLRRPTYEATKRVVTTWNRGTFKAFAGMPVEMDVDFDARLRAAYWDTCNEVDKIIQAPTSPDSLCIMAGMNVMGSGFANRIRVDGAAWNASKGPTKRDVFNDPEW